jgi:hypothetical protein
LNRGCWPGFPPSACSRIWWPLTAFTGGYDAVKRFVRRLGARIEPPFRRMECEPGREVQVDFGQGARVVDEQGKRRKTHLFRCVLSHSRKGYPKQGAAFVNAGSKTVRVAG